MKNFQNGEKKKNDLLLIGLSFDIGSSKRWIRVGCCKMWTIMAIPPPILCWRIYCSVCEQIAHNSKLELGSTLRVFVNIPLMQCHGHVFFFFFNYSHIHTTRQHLQCMHYVCKLTQCEYFTSLSCPVIRSRRGRFRIHGSVSCKVFMFILSWCSSNGIRLFRRI